MKNNKSHFLRFKTPGLAALIFLASLVGAVAQTADHLEDGSLKEVKFVGALVSDVVDFMRDRFPETNFVTAGPLDQITVSLTLRNVDLGELLLALQIATDNAIEINEVMGDDMIAIRANVREAENMKMLRAFNIAGYLGRVVGPVRRPYKDDPDENKRREKAIIALEILLTETWNDLHRAEHGTGPTDEERKSWPMLKFHREALLLVAIGDEEHLAVIEEIVGALD